MITIDDATVSGDYSGDIDAMDRDTVAIARLSGWRGEDPWYAAQWLRQQYADIIRTAGAVTLAIPAAARVWATA